MIRLEVWVGLKESYFMFGFGLFILFLKLRWGDLSILEKI